MFLPVVRHFVPMSFLNLGNMYTAQKLMDEPKPVLKLETGPKKPKFIFPVNAIQILVSQICSE